MNIQMLLWLIFVDVLGMTAPQAAGVIHSDFEKGFIRAETVSILIPNFLIPFTVVFVCEMIR